METEIDRHSGIFPLFRERLSVAPVALRSSLKCALAAKKNCSSFFDYLKNKALT
ncbi:MAG: hypothetical protein ABI870_02435 [Rhodanobacter sp.]